MANNPKVDKSETQERDKFMNLTPEIEQSLKLVAEDTLSQFKKVSDTAQNALNNRPVSAKNVLADPKSFTSDAAIKQFGQISRENRESYTVLEREPAIARVVVADDNGKGSTYFICRSNPLNILPNLASYHAPVGRLAALPIGDTLTLPNGRKLEILERSRLHPGKDSQGWDSKDTVFEGEGFRPFTIESLRALIRTVADEQEVQDVLGKILAEEKKAANIVDGLKRNVISKMSLRDQPILDQYQDEIFRLSLDSRLLILGPPGTGKTTTLIRRLGLKLDLAFLDDDEKLMVESVGASNGNDHKKSWLMFTPTELLKQYLKEAFAREGVPASDLRIRTWADYRRDLARNTFGVLRTANAGGFFILKENVNVLSESAHDDPISWYTDFFGWQNNAFISETRKAAQCLCENKKPDIAATGKRLLSILGQTSGKTLVATLSSLVAEAGRMQALVASLKDSTDHKIRIALNLQLNNNETFLDDFAKFIDSLQQIPETAADDLDDQDNDDEEADFPRTGRSAAVSRYMQVVRAQARAYASKRNLGKNSRNGIIIEWLGDRSLTENDLAEVGAKLLVQSSARRFVNPVKRYMNSIPKRYRAFRRLRQKEGKWYLNDGFTTTDLHPLELDVLLLCILRGANDFLSRPNVFRNVAQPVWSSLEPVFHLYQNQILVDEVTDFSPIQIACIAALAHPQISSFFACGDFNQRLTTWGSHSIEEMNWVFPEIEVKKVTVAYRQSRQLNDLARSIILATGGQAQEVTLPEHVDSEGVAPALLEGVAEVFSVVDWLANRIREIERFVGKLPSIAIFVENETDVQPVADALAAALADENTQVVACPKGQVMGQDNDVRVFDVQHIKGLEFEAVFFIGIDRLAILHPQLFDKYLYVGTTRAATYLGVTCDGNLPDAISSLRPMFVPDWKNP